MDRVLAIEGVELIGINNRNLGKSLNKTFFKARCTILLDLFYYPFSETFEVDIGITKKLLEGERGELIRQKDILVSSIHIPCFSYPLQSYTNLT